MERKDLQLGEKLKTIFIAGLRQAGQLVTDDEIGFVKQHGPSVDLGICTRDSI